MADEGASYLAHMLQVTVSLTELHLERNIIRDVGAKALAEGLQSNASLLVLTLEGNPFSKYGANAIVNAALHKMPGTKSLQSRLTHLSGVDAARAPLVW